MAIKAELNKLTRENKSNYPCLKVISEYGTVVLFKREKCGVVIKAEVGAVRRIGDYSETWAEENFELLNDSVTLSNE